MAIFKRFKKVVSKARKGIRTGAKKFLTSRRKYGWVKKNKVSSMGVAKAVANLSRRLAVSAEYKTLDQAHTSGSPDVTLRQYFRIAASAQAATVSTTTTPGTSGYLLRQVSLPTQGDGAAQYDGQKYSIESIQWKGSVWLSETVNGATGVRLYIVEHKDNVDQPFTMSEFLSVDSNGEYSMMSKRGRDNYRDYRVVASRQFTFNVSDKRRFDFNILAKVKSVMRIQDDGQVPRQYYCVAVASPDVGANLTSLDYVGNTRMRFVH